MIGIGGIAMGTLALMFRESGWQVKGSDAGLYPPMSEMLDRAGIPVAIGYDTNNIGDPDLVVVGNAVSRGNPEVEYLLNRDLPYMSMPSALARYFLEGKRTIVVAGTHGKTTTAAILAHILVTAGKEPSFFIGGILKGYGAGYRLGKGDFFVVEGDEYDSAFFEKYPKMIQYRPSHLLLTSMEYDHADIYDSMKEIETWFSRLVRMVPSQGWILANGSFDSLAEMAVSSFSGNACLDRELFRKREKGCIVIQDRDFPSISVKSDLRGDFNSDNIVLAVAMARRLGVDDAFILRGLESFKGVRRRQDILFDHPRCTVIEDFAHHPTAVKAVTTSIRQQYPGRTIWQLYEPASATGSRSIFQEELPESFLRGEPVIIRRPEKMDRIEPAERLDLERVVERIRSCGSEASVFNTSEEIVRYLSKAIDTASAHGILIMSNGGFDNIYRILVERLRGIFHEE